jgi:hypothetical protein
MHESGARVLGFFGFRLLQQYLPLADIWLGVFVGSRQSWTHTWRLEKNRFDSFHAGAKANPTTGIDTAPMQKFVRCGGGPGNRATSCLDACLV